MLGRLVAMTAQFFVLFAHPTFHNSVLASPVYSLQWVSLLWSSRRGRRFFHMYSSQKQQILFQICIQPLLYLWCLESEPTSSLQMKTESNTPAPFLLHILEMTQRSWCRKHDCFCSKPRLRVVGNRDWVNLESFGGLPLVHTQVLGLQHRSQPWLIRPGLEGLTKKYNTTKK